VGNGVPCFEVRYKTLDLVELVLLNHGITATGDTQVASCFRIRVSGFIFYSLRMKLFCFLTFLVKQLCSASGHRDLKIILK